MLRFPVTLFAASTLFLAGCQNEGAFRNQPVPPVAIVSGLGSGPASDLFEFELDGARSYDPNALEQSGIYTWEWTLVQVPDGANADIGDEGEYTTMTTDTPGPHVVQLRVRDINDFAWSEPTLFTVRAFPVTGFAVQLTWTTDVNDVDLHLIAESEGGTLFDETFDCHFANLRPEWGAAGLEGDPSLNEDNVDGYGPEVIEMGVPTIGQRYHVLVHYFSDDGFADSDATVAVWINGLQESELERNLVANQLWDVGVLDWSGATGTWGAVDTVGVY